MRWIILALVVCFTFASTPVGSANYRVVRDPMLLIYGDNAETSEVVYCPAPKPMQGESLKQIRVKRIASALEEYTDADDAKKTANRYCEGSEDPYMWAAMDVVESGCDRDAVSPAGAQGRLQVMPFWKHEKGFEFYRGRNSHLNDDLNFLAAREVFKRCLKRTGHERWRAVERYCGTGADARTYVKKVMRVYWQIRQQPIV